jgi:hypothetical protein
MIRRYAAVVPIHRAAAAAATSLAIATGAALAQPEPSFRAGCGGLRAAIARLDRSGDGLITIEVEGVLRDARSDGALAYLLMCAPPDPQVLCVTYSTGGRKAGDRAVVTGNFTQRDPDHVLLDPGLPAPSDQ